MKKVVYALLAFAPVLAAAQGVGNTIALVTNIRALINAIIPVLFAIAIVYFFWGLIKYIGSAGDAKAASEGKSIMIWGIIALAVMVSVYGIINWLIGVANLNNTPIAPPQV